ncbi:hypothetical protein A0256_13945 [Mucilaginibacter sp. PAMC 26640]|nr:hypothetical protein A0256_13945 [Mucilaginibacter sp. PAMC 26640]
MERSYLFSDAHRLINIPISIKKISMIERMNMVPKVEMLQSDERPVIEEIESVKIELARLVAELVIIRAEMAKYQTMMVALTDD